MRTSILGVLNFNGMFLFLNVLYIFFTLDLEKVVANTSAISRVTHADPRCTASCVAMTTAVSSKSSMHCI